MAAFPPPPKGGGLHAASSMNEEERDRNSRYEAEERDRNSRLYRDYQERPSAISLFLRLGYDVTNNEDVQRLASDLRWASEKRKTDTEKNGHLFAIFVSGFISMASVALTVFGQWVVAKLTGSK